MDTENNTKNNIDSRWFALDFTKSIGLIGALLCHVLIWWYGINLAPSGEYLIRLNSFRILAEFYLVLVSILIISSGAAFYFYFIKPETSSWKICKRSIILAVIGIIIGLNTKPFYIYWNIFLFYAVSLILLYIIYKYWKIKGIALITIISFITTIIFEIIPQNLNGQNYIINIIIGDPNGIKNNFPIFPWISTLGFGFLISYIFKKIKNNENQKKYKNIILNISIIILCFSIPFLNNLDYNNVFGVTAKIPISFILFCLSLFSIIITTADKIIGTKNISAYNLIEIISRNMLKIYLVTIFSILFMIYLIRDLFIINENNMLTWFIILNILTFIIIYATGYKLTKKLK